MRGLQERGYVEPSAHEIEPACSDRLQRGLPRRRHRGRDARRGVAANMVSSWRGEPRSTSMRLSCRPVRPRAGGRARATSAAPRQPRIPICSGACSTTSWTMRCAIRRRERRCASRRSGPTASSSCAFATRGQGVPAAAQMRIFDRAFQLDDAKKIAPRVISSALDRSGQRAHAHVLPDLFDRH